MPTTPRPLKANNHSTYQGEVASGKLDIIDAEIDKDLDTLYNLINGGLDNANIAANAAIVYSKLTLTGQIKDSDIAANANISQTKLAPLNLTGLAGTIGTANITDGAVTKAKLAGGSTVYDQSMGGDETLIGLNAGELLLGECVWNSHGSLCLLFGTISGEVNTPAGGGFLQITSRLRLDSNPGTASGAVIRTAIQSVATAGASAVAATFPWSVFLMVSTGLLAVGGHRLSLTAQLSNTGSGLGVSTRSHHVMVSEAT